MPSLGELFIELGFDVDSQKLKDFESGIKSLEGHMLKLGAVATGSVFGLDAFVSKVADKATAIRQFGEQTGYSTKALQEWASVINQTNPLVSVDSAIEKYKSFTTYLTDMYLGKGGGQMLSRLGVNPMAGTDPAIVLEQLSQKLPWAIQRWGRPGVSSILNDIGLGADSLDALLLSSGKRAGMTQGKIVSEDEINRVDQVNEKLKEFEQQLQRIGLDIVDKFGPAFITFLQTVEHELEAWIPRINAVAQAFGGWQRIGEALLIFYTGRWLTGMLLAIGQVTTAALGVGVALGRGALGLYGINAAGLAAGGAFLTGAGALAGGFAAGSWLADKSGLGQGFADLVAPVKLPPRVEHITITNNNGLTQHIQSTADAGAVGAEAHRLYQQHLDNAMAGINFGTGTLMADTLDGLISEFQAYVVAPLNAFGLGGFLFDVAGESTAHLSTDITDHYAEDNESFQDQIAIRPKKVTLKGYVGEVVYRAKGSGSGGVLQQAVQKLTEVSAYLPVLSSAATQIQTSITEGTLSNIPLGDASNLYGLVQNLLSATGDQARQANAFMYFEALMNQKMLISIQTPWKFMTNMAIETMTAIQPEGSKYMTDFAITLKEIRIASTLSTAYTANPSGTPGGALLGQFQGVSALQAASPVPIGNVPGASLPSSLLAGAQSYIGQASDLMNISSVAKVFQYAASPAH